MAVWAVLIFPAILLRAYHYEEGTTVALARGALEDGNWLVPHQYGLRFAERPNAMAWLIAMLGAAFGGIDQVVARIPAVLSLLGGGWLVFYLVRQQASAWAALFGALCFMLCPALLQKLITAETDVMVSALLFAAFVVWWDGHKAGPVSVRRWIAVGLVLSAAAMTKGPQPVAYFTLGVGAYLVLYREWRELPGFLLANAMAGAVVLAWYAAVYQPGDVDEWRRLSRLNVWVGWLPWTKGIGEFVGQVLLENLPALLLAVPFAVSHLRSAVYRRDDPVPALVIYVLVCTVILIFWPGVRARYAMPALLPVAVLGGLGYDRFIVTQRKLLDIAIAVAMVCAIYAAAVNWIAMPFWPHLFQKSWIAAKKMNAVIGERPWPIYCAFPSLNNGIVAYLRAPIREVDRAHKLATYPAPAWALLHEQEVAELRKLRPDWVINFRAEIHADSDADLYEIVPAAR